MSDTQHTAQHTGFLTGPIRPVLLRFTVPLFLSLFLQALYGGVDLAVVGWFAPTESVAAVATGSQVMQVLSALIIGLTMGTTVLLGKALGGRDYDSATRIVTAQSQLFAGLAIILTLFMVFLAPTIAQAMQVPPSALSETIRYIRICSLGIVFITAYNAISGIFRAAGNSRCPLLFVMIACGINIVLDIVLVAGFCMQASGAALATVIAQAGSVLFSLWYIRRHPFKFPIVLKQHLDSKTILAILKIGAPIALQDFLTSLSFLIITGIVNTLGVVASAAVGVAEKLFVFLSIVPMAFMSALSTFVAHNMGAHQSERAKQALFCAQRISLLLGIGIFFLTFLRGDLLAKLFVKDPIVIEACMQYLRGSAPEYVMIPLTLCFLGYFNGREYTTFVMAQGLLATFLVRIPLSYMLSNLTHTSMFLISLAIPVSAFVNLACCIGFFFFLKKKDSNTALQNT